MSELKEKFVQAVMNLPAEDQNHIKRIVELIASQTPEQQARSAKIMGEYIETLECDPADRVKRFADFVERYAS